MPSWPIEIASLTAMVVNSSGNPRPADALLGKGAWRPSGRLQGDLVPGRRDADLGLAEVVLGHADRPEHGPRGARS